MLAIRLAGDCMLRKLRPLVRGAGLGLGLLATAATSWARGARGRPLTWNRPTASDRRAGSGGLEEGVVVVGWGASRGPSLEGREHTTGHATGAALGLLTGPCSAGASRPARATPAGRATGRWQRPGARPGAPAQRPGIVQAGAARDWVLATPGMMLLPDRGRGSGWFASGLLECAVAFRRAVGVMERKPQAVWTVSRVSLTLVLVAACHVPARAATGLRRSAHPRVTGDQRSGGRPAGGPRGQSGARGSAGDGGGWNWSGRGPPAGPIRARPLAGERPLDRRRG